jgi:hypothetical protein
MAYLVAIDPGKATGVAELYPDNTFESAIVDTDGAYRLLEFWMTGPKESLPDAIICEDYLVTQQTIQKSRQNYSLELIGVARFVCSWRDVPFILQTPSEAKSFATDNKLKKLGWYKSGAGHDNDASRHLLVYAINNGVIKPEVFI